MESNGPRTFQFDEFELDAARRQLRKNGEPVALNAKTFDLLLALVERRGEVASKEELLDTVWPGQFVEEGNLTVQISTLRKIFGERRDDHRFVVTVPGRGYSFVAEVGAANDDLVIERHSRSRIIIDEDLDSYLPDGGNAAEPPDPQSLRRASARRSVRIALASALFLSPVLFLLVRWNATPSNDVQESQLAIKRLTSNGRVSFAALSPDGKMFAYALKELEQNSLWLGFVEGGEDKVLRASETGRYNDLSFSADGNFVYFTFSGAESRESVLYRIPAFGGVREKIRSNVTSFGMAPDGQRFAFARYNAETKANQLIISRADTGEDQIAIDLPGVESFGAESISWSLDGKAIAFGGTPSAADQKHDQVFIVQTADGAVRQVTGYGWKEVIKTDWEGNGEALLLVAQEKDSNTSVSYSQIWRVSLPDGEVKQLTHDLSSYRSVLNAVGSSFLTVELRQMNNVWVAPYSDLSKHKQVTFGTFGKYDGLWGLDWTADGRIVFTSTDHQSQVISIMNADGTDIQQLTPPGYNDSFVNTSNDGRYIVFQSTRAGGSDIWRMDSTGGNVVRLTSDGRSSQPFISADSRMVYYKSAADGSGGLHRLPIEGGTAEKLTDEEVSYLSISPDGTHVAAGSGTKLRVFSINGGQAIRQFDLTRFGTLSGNTRWSPDGVAVAYRDRGYGYWLQPATGGEPKRMAGLPIEKFYNFAWSKDGKYFAFVRGQEIRDAVIFGRETK